jgi:hypothetical protein
MTTQTVIIVAASGPASPSVLFCIEISALCIQVCVRRSGDVHAPSRCSLFPLSYLLRWLAGPTSQDEWNLGDLFSQSERYSANGEGDSGGDGDGSGSSTPICAPTRCGIIES